MKKLIVLSILICLYVANSSPLPERCNHEDTSCGLSGVCCAGLTCYRAPGARLWIGVCKKTTIPTGTCQIEGTLCDEKIEGAKCCEGLSCFTSPETPAGDSGVCVRNTIASILK